MRWEGKYCMNFSSIKAWGVLWASKSRPVVVIMKDQINFKMIICILYVSKPIHVYMSLHRFCQKSYYELSLSIPYVLGIKMFILHKHQFLLFAYLWCIVTCYDNDNAAWQSIAWNCGNSLLGQQYNYSMITVLFLC